MMRWRGALQVAWIALGVLLGATPMQAQSGGASAQSEQLLEEGREQLINLRFDAAHETFRLLAEKGRPGAAHYHRSTIYLLKALCTDDPDDFEAFFDHADEFGQVVDEMPDSPWRDYYAGELNLHRALANVKTEHYIRAALAARRAYKGFERAVERAPNFYDAYKGLGLVHLAIGATPGGYRRLLHFFGYSGEIEQGVQELELAAQRSQYGRDEADLILALTAVTMSRDPEHGQALLAQLRERHPESPLVDYLYGFVLLENRRADEAQEALVAARSTMLESDVFYVDYVDYYLGETYFVLNRFEQAAEAYQRYLSTHEGVALHAMATYKRALALEMDGRRDQALPIYRTVGGDRDYDSDRWARERATERVDQPLTELERRLLITRNLFDAGRYDEAQPDLERLFEDEQHPLPVRAEAAYRLGRLHHAQEAYQAALPYYQWAIDHPLDGDAKFAPWSQFYVGLIRMEQQAYGAAETALRAALAYEGDFDYKYGLEQRAKAALERLPSSKG